MNKIYSIQNVSADVNAVTVTLTDSRKIVLAGTQFSDALNRANLPVNKAVFLALGNGVGKFNAEVIDVKEGEPALDKDGKQVIDNYGQPVTYRKDHTRLVGYDLNIVNAMEVLSNVNPDVVDIFTKMKGMDSVTFERKNPLSAIKASLLGAKPAVQDNVPDVVDESLNGVAPKGAKKPVEKALETASEG